MKSAASSFMVILILVGTLIVAFDIRSVQAIGTIYIRGDGSIEPSEANITTTDNVTYTFTDDNYASIVVERSNIVVDGNGYTLQGLFEEEEDSIGFYWKSVNNVTIKNTTINGFWYGVYLDNSSRNILCGNYIPWCLFRPCIYLIQSSHNLISGNTLRGIGYGQGIRGQNSSDNNISGNDIEIGWRSVGLTLDGNNNLISGNRIYGNSYGGVGISGDNNTVTGNYIAANYEGDGIGLSGNSNSLIGNTITDHYCGISINYSSNNTLTENNIANNTECSICISSSSNNAIYHNNFINNGLIECHNSANLWDDDYPSGGNYWSDYSGVDENVDGIGDTPYVIDENNQDNYPLMEPWTPSTPVVTATVNICPHTLNLRGKGRWITAYIELSEGFNVADINVSSISLNEAISSELRPTCIDDFDGDGIPDLMVKFDRAAVISYILSHIDISKPNQGGSVTVTLTLTGTLNDGTPFEGSSKFRITIKDRRGGGRSSFMK